MLGRYTTGPVAARAEHSRGAPACRRRAPPGPRPRPTLYSGPMARIDLRSDTVTKPSPAMRRAMAEAEVGDDVFGDDPTVNALEERAAELLGKEAGLFVASGTMGNLVAQMAHLARGQETIAGREHHLVIDEAAGHAVIVGTSIRSLEDRPDGTVDPAEIEAAFRDPNDPHEPITGLVTIENTHAHSMGQPLDRRRTRARSRTSPTATASRSTSTAPGSGTPSSPRACAPTDLADPADTVTFCLSKGLACPVGSLVVGRRDVIWRARRARKMVGGGMRQAGILAAAGLVALSDGPNGMIERLAEDHANARRLAEALAAMDGIVAAGGTAQPGDGPLDPARVRTNFVLFRVERDRAAFLDALRARDVEMVEYPHGQVRAVTHYGVTSADIDTTIEATRAALAETSRTPWRRDGAGRGLTRPSLPSPLDQPQLASPRATCRRAGGSPAVIDPRSCRAAAATRPGDGAGPARRDVLRPRRDPLRPARPGQPGARHRPWPPRGRRPARRRQPRCRPRRARRGPRAPGRGRGDRSGRPVGRRAFERDLELHNVRRSIFDTRRPAAVGTPLVRARHVGDGLFLLFARDHAPLARAARRDRRPARGGRDLPRGSQDPGDCPAGPQLAARRARDRRGAAVVLRRARRRRRGRAAGRRAAPPRARERIGQARRRAVRGLARGHARWRHGRLGDRARAARRDGRAASLRRPRFGRDPGARLGAPARRARGARRRPPARSTRPPTR